MVKFHLWKLFSIQDFSLSDEADTAERQWHVVRLGQQVFFLKVLVHVLANARVGTISSNKDVAMVGRVVRASDHDSQFVLQDRHNLFAHMDSLFGDLAQQEVINVWTGNNVAASA